MTSEKIKYRDYILHRYINAGGKIMENDYLVFGYPNRIEFAFKLAALERAGTVEYQFVERRYSTCVVYEYFYSLPGKGTPTIKNSHRRMLRKKEEQKYKTTPEQRYMCRRTKVRKMFRSLQKPRLTELFGKERALHWVHGTFRGTMCSDINIVATFPTKFKDGN